MSLAALATAPQCLAQTAPVRFSVGDRTLFAEYRLLGREQVAVTFAFEPARTSAAAASLEKMGSQVLGRRDAIGYLYARVPIDRVESLLELRGLEALQLAALPIRASMDEGPVVASTRGSSGRSRSAAPTPSVKPENPFTG